MMRPFRFGVHFRKLPPDRWIETAQEIERLGFSSLHFPDHFHSQWDPIAAPAAAAAVTSRLCVGALVYGVDYRHPVVLAKASATIALLSHGRFECGIGAGWLRSDYSEAGMAFDAHSKRISRLEEAVQILKGMWASERFSFEGEHYRIQQIAQAVALPNDLRPKLIIGGGRPKILAVAGRHADIVGINAGLTAGRVTATTALDMTEERVQQKLDCVRAGLASAGRDMADIELNTICFFTNFVDNPEPVRAFVASSTGMTVDQVADCPFYLIGSAAEIRDALHRRRERTGISYIVIKSEDMALLRHFAEHVVEPLAGR